MQRIASGPSYARRGSAIGNLVPGAALIKRSPTPLHGPSFAGQRLRFCSADVLRPQLAPHLTHFILVVLGGGLAMTVLPPPIARFTGIAG